MGCHWMGDKVWQDEADRPRRHVTVCEMWTTTRHVGATPLARVGTASKPSHASLVVRNGRRFVVEARNARPGMRSGRGPPGKKNLHLINRDIRAPEVRLQGENKEALGIMDVEEALDRAREVGLDLVCIQEKADPPVCRLLDYKKFLYDEEKKKKEAKKKSAAGRVEVKELKLRPNTDVHDYQVRLRSAQKFLSKGDKVKINIQFRGREMEFKNIGQEICEKFIADLGDSAVVEGKIRMEGRNMLMFLAPSKT